MLLLWPNESLATRSLGVCFAELDARQERRRSAQLLWLPSNRVITRRRASDPSLSATLSLERSSTSRRFLGVVLNWFACGVWHQGVSYG
jgi:hypothetical protein